MKFEDYPIAPEIKRNLADLGFRRPTDIQFKAIPSIIKGEDVLAIAHTGTGKTAAFAIPIINRLHQGKSSKRSAGGIKCLVMVPTHELAQQVTGVFSQLAKHTLVNAYCIFGGVEQAPQIARLLQGVDVLVATPGRTFDLIHQGYIKLEHLEVLVLDEADHMLALGFIKDIRDLMRHLPRHRQTLFFSATINEAIKDLAYSLVVNPIRIQLSPKDPVSKNVDHFVVFVEMDDKRFFLERVIRENENSKILVFVRTKVRAERVLKAMARMGIATISIHGDKTQAERDEAMQQFRSGSSRVLVATDVSARGIDIPDVDYVINYDLPDIPENYVHRVGRTGRGVRRGQAIAFCSEEEREVLDNIEGFMGKPINVRELDKETYLNTRDASLDTGNGDWKTLVREVEALEEFEKKKGKKKKKGSGGK